MSDRRAHGVMHGRRLQDPEPQTSGRLIKPLHGHSGCAISLWKGHEGYFVRKISASLSYNTRLENQARKQRSLANLGIPTPAILSQGYCDQLFYFDMAYVPGIVADQAMLGDRLELDRLVAFFCQTLETLSQSSTDQLSARLFEEKINSALGACSRLLADHRTRWRVDRIRGWLTEADWSGIPKSHCHGDLTLENTIISASGEFSLIDFLDGPLTTFWLDVAKLYQDFTAHWFLREKPEMIINPSERSYAMLSAAYVGEALRRRLEPTMPKLFANLNHLVGLQLFRILPYCQRAPILEYALSRLENLMRRPAGCSGDTTR